MMKIRCRTDQYQYRELGICSTSNMLLLSRRFVSKYNPSVSGFMQFHAGESFPRKPHTQETIQVVFLRHGQSTWNQQNIFIGMTDTPLTEDGVLEARAAGRLLAESGIEIDEVYTSLLRRSTKTVWLTMQEMQLEWAPVVKDWRLNERNYGALVGMNKKECVERYGKEVNITLIPYMHLA
jgi:hypothetical protein